MLYTLTMALPMSSMGFLKYSCNVITTFDVRDA
jgi:hypothetical protein